jgi:hypothetical protein
MYNWYLQFISSYLDLLVPVYIYIYIDLELFNLFYMIYKVFY